MREICCRDEPFVLNGGARGSLVLAQTGGGVGFAGFFNPYSYPLMNAWKYEENMIEQVTRGSFKLMDLLLQDHVARLMKMLTKFPGDTDYQEMHGVAASELSLWNGAYVPYRAARGVYKARTQSFYEMLESLPGLLDDWDIDIQAAGGPTKPYKAGKAAYTEIFPQGRAPFTSGAVDQRVAAVQTLVANLQAHAPLAAVLGTVTTFAGQFAAARLAQQGEEGGSEVNSEGLEMRRLSAADKMFRNIGRAMTKFGAAGMIGKMFDLNYIRDGATPPPDDAPGAPQGFTVVAVSGPPGDGQANWSPVAGVDGYNLYRRPVGDPAWTLAGSAGPGDTNLIITGQPLAVPLEYAVAAFNAAGEGPKSVPDEVTF